MFFGEFKLLCNDCRGSYLVTAAVSGDSITAADKALVRQQAHRHGWKTFSGYGPDADYCPTCAAARLGIIGPPPVPAAVQSGG